ncbi:NAD(P)H-dependent oxidoreductase [Sedimenticola hydrogenitrophicus]|uniref:NAD(P)H-dependent oxidoreductase n=1 Tax=Sedimenticola hydrogenitrophicus TaxID=2967975 RepID=UPI0023AF3AE7|nr:NAD(P)H-dependent oxidoreductase [Sedimenticola hydrogenitrophicus]
MELIDRRPFVIGISGSTRSISGKPRKGTIIDIVNQSEDETALRRAFCEDDQLNTVDRHVKQLGIRDGDGFNLYKSERKKTKRNKTFSNTEVALATALYGAKEAGADIDHLQLNRFFYPTPRAEKLRDLKEALLRADGIVLATPVYFGDRSSLISKLIDFIRSDAELKEALSGTIMGGIAVAAKRNGGQETSLIYQLMDMLEIGFLGVGNDWRTTAQYGGTCHAGDVGMMASDHVGIETAMGVGRRVGNVARMSFMGEDHQLLGRHRIIFLVTQDKDEIALQYVKALTRRISEAESTVINVTKLQIHPCQACDLCPATVGPDKDSRCVVTSPDDDMQGVYDLLMNADVVVPVTYNPTDRTGLESAYQSLMERLRFMRRSNYMLSDRLIAPLVLEEIGAGQNMHIRMITSLIRQHSIVARPMQAYFHNGVPLNELDITRQFATLNQAVRNITRGRLLLYANPEESIEYQTVGYFSDQFEDAEEKARVSRLIHDDRVRRYQAEANKRLKPLQETMRRNSYGIKRVSPV